MNVISARNFLYLCAAVYLALISCNAQASVECTVALPVVTFALPPALTVVQDAPLGKSLTGWLDTPEVQTHNNCVFTDTLQGGAGASATGSYMGNTSEDGTTYEIFNSPAPGIGYIIRGKDRHGVYTPITRDFSFFIHRQSPYYDTRFSVKLVATGQPMVSGLVPGFQAGEFRVAEGQNFSAPSLLFMPAITVLAETCAVTNSAVTFQLPLIATKDLPEVGSVAGSTMQAIQIDCQSEVDVYMVVSDVTTPGNRSSTLTLSSTSTAAGIGIELLYLGQPVFFGPDSSIASTENQFLVGKKLLGAASIPLTARYIRTSLTLREGSVRALATFTLSYQ
jgi:type 1 fimbria pilin